jgi:glycosyltransferase involved in cell wall biosynthesis
VLFDTHPQSFTPNFVRIARATSRIAVKRAKLLFTVSAYSRESICASYGVAPERVFITCNGVDRARFSPGAQGGDVPQRYGLAAGEYLCCIGRLEPRKNHLALVRAYATLGPNCPPLAIVGQRDFSFGAVFEEVERLGLSGRIHFLEHVDDADMPALLRHARLFVYPTHAEGFGMPVAEALASGVPVITSTTTALPEVAGEAATLVHPDDVPGLGAAIRAALAASPAARAERSAQGLRQAEKFTWRRSAQVLVDGFRRCAAVV